MLGETAINRIDLFKSLEEMIIDYPTPSKEGILEHLYEELYSRLGDSPEGIEMYVNRVLKGEDLIDRVKRGNEELSKAVSKSKGLRVVYERFVNEWCGKDIDDNLVSCLYYIYIYIYLSPNYYIIRNYI